MAYEQKPNGGSLFKNERKQKDTHPDMTGTHVDEHGKKWNIAAWRKFKPSNDEEYFTYSITEIKPKSNG